MCTTLYNCSTKIRPPRGLACMVRLPLPSSFPSSSEMSFPPSLPHLIPPFLLCTHSLISRGRDSAASSSLPLSSVCMGAGFALFPSLLKTFAQLCRVRWANPSPAWVGPRDVKKAGAIRTFVEKGLSLLRSGWPSLLPRKGNEEKGGEAY